jgi:hypothetical protein
MPKRKLIPIGKLTDKVARRMQLLVRLKASDDYGYCQCVSCGVSKHYKDMQGGHFIPRGCSETKLMEENIHPQCPGCNGFGMKHGTAAQQYTIWMQDYYGNEFVEKLLEIQRAKKPFKWVRANLNELLEDVNQQIKEHEKRVL